MKTVNSNTARNLVTERDTLEDIYRTNIEYVECQKERVEYLIEMISEKDKINAMRSVTLQQVAVVNFFSKSSELENILGNQNELVSLLKNISEKATKFSEFKHRKPCINISENSRLLDAKYWTKLLEQQIHLLDTYQTGILKIQQQKFVMYKLQPVIITIVMVVGMTSNGLLLTIFVRHKEIRTLPNIMLINLTVVDLVSLVVNVLLDHLRVTTHWQVGRLGCQNYFFFSYLLFAVSTYSVAMISVQRFVGIRQLYSRDSSHQSKYIKCVFIAPVWCLAFILSVPHAVSVYTKNENCEAISLDYFVSMYTADLFTFCVVPLLITAVFSGLTAYRMQQSVREFPGEATGQEQLKHGRMVSSNVLIGLTVIFFVSYAPFFLFKFLIFVVGISKSFWEYILVNTITYYLRFVNCCLNPIVLFVMNKRFRGYIKRYSGQREVQTANNGGGNIAMPMHDVRMLININRRITILKQRNESV
jgi:hypothetical protein